MTIHTNIPAIPMAHSDYKSIQDSKQDSISPKSMEVYHHVLNKVMDIKNQDEIEYVSKWMTYRGCENFTDLCVDFHCELYHIHDFSNYRVDGMKCALKFGTMNKHRLFVSWMAMRIEDTTFELYAEHVLALTQEQYNDFRQQDMIRMTRGPTSQPPEPTTPMTTFYWSHKGNDSF